MGTNCTNNNSINSSEGTTQLQRYLDALDPDSIELMGFSVEEWMDFAYKFSEKVSFYKDNPDNTTTSWKSFFEKANEIKSMAKEYTTGDIDPHLTLFICFLKLLETSKKQFDGITKRHLDFYYYEVLQLKKQPFTPDKVYSLFELAKNVDNQQLAKNALLDGAKDTNGQTRNYAIIEELVVNKCAIAQLKATYLDNQGWYEAPIPNSGDGQGGDFKNESNSWMPFGNSDYTNANFGFTISAPSLKMGDGPRSITVLLKLAGKNGLIATPEEFTESLVFSITGKSDWIPLPITKEKISVSNGEIEFKLELSETDDQIINYDTTLHLGNYNATHPLLKISFDNVTKTIANTSFKLYKKLINLTINDIIITTTSLYNKSLLVQNDTGTVNTESAFFPFGPLAKKNAKLKIRADEWTGKNIIQAVLKMDWKDLPDSFAAYYDLYTEDTVYKGINSNNSSTIVKKTMGDDRFTVQKSIISENRNTQSDLKTPTQILGEQQTFWVDRQNQLVALLNQNTEELTNQIISQGNLELIKQDTTIAENALFKSPEHSEFSFFAENANGYIPLTSDEYLLQLELEEDFFHDVFGRVLTAQAIAKQAAPNAPYTPYAENISVTITTKEHLNTLDKHIELFHNYPYGQIKIDPSTEANIVLNYIPKGELFLGLENCIEGENVQFLFQLEEGTENPDSIVSEGYSEIEWHYLQDNVWVKFNKEQLLKDETNNFLKTGLVKFQIPKNFDTCNTLLPDNLFWVRASQKSKTTGNNLPDTVSRFIEIHPQALKAEFLNQENSLEHLQNGIPANTISKLINRIATVKKITQPFASFDGAPEEDDTNFYRRISERLRHKNRAITLWDYEHLMLQKFKYLHKVKCLNHSTYDTNQSPGEILLVVVPGIKNQNVFNVYEPQVSANKLTEIEEYINGLNTSLVNAKVVSPVYEPVIVSLYAKFHPEYDNNLYTKILKEDIAKFLAPWAFDTEASISFNNTLYASEMIFYIENLNYVDYIKEFALTHNGIPRQQVTPTDEKSILTSVPASEHKIEYITASICTI
ncbi:baseplate J/gp47 family protein [Aquimarina sp. RZ0]|uniref:baseplate J/gp47 family protein n=1 Tax=Aquimarina sp. RZ0 TaxID=2607730 RepID=UPI0011F25DE6|nr:baseplate J/gp47 family protein [Aquimarina sp. RZ0]KAA1248052.1 hypothetical protein F0000_00205 [Aquimarina sp. RZ0]